MNLGMKAKGRNSVNRIETQSQGQTKSRSKWRGKLWVQDIGKEPSFKKKDNIEPGHWSDPMVKCIPTCK